MRKFVIEIGINRRISRLRADNPRFIAGTPEPQTVIFTVIGGIVEQIIDISDADLGSFRIDGCHKHEFRHLKPLSLIFQKNFQKGCHLAVVYGAVGSIKNDKIEPGMYKQFDVFADDPRVVCAVVTVQGFPPVMKRIHLRRTAVSLSREQFVHHRVILFILIGDILNRSLCGSVPQEIKNTYVFFPIVAGHRTVIFSVIVCSGCI